MSASRAVFSIASGYPEYLCQWATPHPWDGQPKVILGGDHHPYPCGVCGGLPGEIREGPGAFAMHGFITMNMIKDAIHKAGGVQPEALVETMKSLSFDSIVGRLSIRTSDNKVTMGSWVGKTALRSDTGALVD